MKGAHPRGLLELGIEWGGARAARDHHHRAGGRRHDTGGDAAQQGALDRSIAPGTEHQQVEILGCLRKRLGGLAMEQQWLRSDVVSHPPGGILVDALPLPLLEFAVLLGAER